jgi:hypothetical protein
MSVIGSNVLAGASGQSTGDFEISRSLRFNSGDSANLSKTFGSASNRRTWSWSGWVKRSAVGTKQILFGVQGTSDTTYVENYFATDDKLYLRFGYTSVAEVRTTQVFRDVSAWMHIVIAFDVTESAAADKLKLYINGSQVTDFSTDTRSSFSNQDYGINRAGAHKISGAPNGSGDVLDAYLAEVNFIDGSALGPTSFGETDDNGVWQGIDTAGLSFGTNGFRLKFADNSGATATTLGKDTSGNNNNWTPNNLSVAAGVGNDSLVDSPSNGTQTDTGAGGEVVGNYATLNPLNAHTSSDTFSNGNLDFTTSSGGGLSESTIAMSSGKYYFEVVFSGGQGTNQLAGIRKPGKRNYNDSYIYVGTGNKYTDGGSGASYGASLTNGDVIGTAFDADNGTLTFYKNGASQGTAFTGITGTYAFFVGSFGSSPTYVANFGQRAFAHPVSGYKSLNTASLPEPTIADGSKYFDAKVWTGDGTGSRSFTGYSFSPDFAWVKSRSLAYTHVLWDAVRGAGVSKELQSDSTNAEGGASTNASGYLSAFNPDGFSSTAGTSDNDYFNKSGQTYVGWAWDAGANSDKTYTVTVSGGNFYIDGAQQPTLTLAEGSTYKFDQADSTNATHPLRFSTTSDGTHGGGSEYTTGVTTAGTPGSAGAYTQIVIAASAPTLYAYCTNHSGMGFQVNTSDTGGYTIPAGSLNSYSYNQSQTWSNNLTTTGNTWAGSQGPTKAFNGVAAASVNMSQRNGAGGTITFTFTGLSGSVRVWIGNAGAAITDGNGTARGTNVGNGESWVTLSGDISNYNGSIVITPASDAPSLGAVEVAGRMLVDSGVSVTNVPSIASQVMANPSAGFSIISYTATGSNASIGHGLNAAPAFFFGRNRDDTSTSLDWIIYHQAIGNTARLKFNIGAKSTSSAFFQDTSPSSSVISIGTSNDINKSGDDYIIYAFSEVANFSSMGSYLGNGSDDGPFVFTGFKPRFIMTKAYSSNSNNNNNWSIHDTSRDPFNEASEILAPSNPNISLDNAHTGIDILSNGFKLKADTNGQCNYTGWDYLYIAFAQNPFQANGGLAR